MQLFNTLTRTKQMLPATNSPISIYTCGPTVYLDPHIGNWRTFIMYDTLVRVLQYSGADVRQVLNITDVGHLVSDGDDGEDKLAKQANIQRKSAWDIADFYTNQFLTGMNQLNISKPWKLAKATDHIREQIALVETLEKKGFTYVIDDGVYFDTAKVSDYGKLTGTKQEADDDYARVQLNDQKKNSSDFALWKLIPKDETKRDMQWESPWGTGFPGWHLECSAMAQKYLGDTIDIHAGGVDHIPIHHTNEIAQSESASGVEFAKVWMHGEFMKVNGTKLSKSLGNSYTLDDIIQKGFSPIDFRMLVVQGHYRTETNFSWETLEAAHNSLSTLLKAAERRWQAGETKNESQNKLFANLLVSMITALEDDLNTPMAIKSLHEAASEVLSNGLDTRAVQPFIELLQAADKTLGLKLIESTEDISDTEKESISERFSAKMNKDFAASDMLRDRLLENKIQLLDHASGSYWTRQN